MIIPLSPSFCLSLCFLRACSLSHPSACTASDAPDLALHSPLADCLSSLFVPLIGRREGLLKILKSLPVFQALTFPQLERLCATSHEETYGSKDVVMDASTPNKLNSSDNREWVIW